MIKLYFAKPFSAITTLLSIGLIFYMVQSYLKRGSIEFWGRRILLVCFWGLLICITASTRDRFDRSVQYVIDGSVPPGLFTLLSPQSIIGCALGIIIPLVGIISIFTHKQNARQVMFFIISISTIAKLAIIEVSRIAMYITTSSPWEF